jgi:LPS-assembly protein
MYKIFLITILLSNFILAKNSIKDEKIQILAKQLEIKNDIVNASGEVVVYSENYYITANRLIYDKINQKLELFDDVNIIKNNEIVSSSQYMFIDVEKDITNFKPILMFDHSNKIWFNAKNGVKNKDYIDFKSSTLSSCDCQNPAWSINFSSGDLNTTKQWINTYNTTLYIQNIPVFYTPYFGFPTDDTRRSGLLKPSIGYSQSEGFIYAQPIYFAPTLNYDFEYIPQIKNKRGHGHALKYRYTDSLYSNLNIETGIFTEKNEYFNKINLTNDKHYGWDVEYKRTKLFSNNHSSDGLLFKYLDMNDVDYLGTHYDSVNSIGTSSFLESKLKYFYNTNNFYSDIEINMYNDLAQDNTDAVLQTLPKVNFHQYATGFLNNNLTSSLNILSSRKTRTTGIGAVTTDLYIPIGYHQYLFNEFLNFSFTEQINYTNIAYTNKYENANYGENNHVIALYSDLIKPYENYIHSMNVGITYTDTNQFKKSGDIYNKSSNNISELSSFDISQATKNISVSLNQSLYSNMTLKEIVNHKINQSYIYNDITNSYEKNTLQNDLTYYYDYGSLSNRLIYDYGIKDIALSSTTLTFTQDSYFANIYYVYSKNADTLVEDKNLNFDLGFSFAKYYKLSYKENYDLINHVSESKEYIFDINQKCWSINFKLIDKIVATDTTTDDDSFRQKILYLEVNLKQLFLFNQEYEVKKRE